MAPDKDANPRKEPVPVILTGKVWVPPAPPSEAAKATRIAAKAVEPAKPAAVGPPNASTQRVPLVALVVLLLVIPLLGWLFLRGPAPVAAPTLAPMPASVADLAAVTPGSSAAAISATGPVETTADAVSPLLPSARLITALTEAASAADLPSAAPDAAAGKIASGSMVSRPDVRLSPPAEYSPPPVRTAKVPPGTIRVHEPRAIVDRSGENPVPPAPTVLAPVPVETVASPRTADPPAPPARADPPSPVESVRLPVGIAAPPTAEPFSPAKSPVSTLPTAAAVPGEPLTVAVAPSAPANPPLETVSSPLTAEPSPPAEPPVAAVVSPLAADPMSPAVVSPLTADPPPSSKPSVGTVAPPPPPQVTPRETAAGMVVVTGIPSRKKRSRTLLGLRGVLQADGWQVTWISRKDGVMCRSETGETLTVVPGRKKVVFAGQGLSFPVRSEISRDGQLLVPIELLNRVLGGRLSIVKGGTSRSGVNIRLASRESLAPGDSFEELTGVPVIRRRGRLLVGLRMVLEADGWTVDWEGLETGAACRKDGGHLLTVIPAKAQVQWNAAPLVSRPTPTLHRERLFVSLATLEKVLLGRISLVARDRGTSTARIRLYHG